MRYPTGSRVGAAKVRFIRLLFSTASASNHRRENRKVIGYLLGVDREVIYAIKTAGDVNEEDNRLLLCHVRMTFKGSSVEVRCGGMFTFTAFYSMVANLSQAKVKFERVFCVRPVYVPICCSFAKGKEAVFGGGGLGALGILCDGALRWFVRFVKAVVGKGCSKMARVGGKVWLFSVRDGAGGE